MKKSIIIAIIASIITAAAASGGMWYWKDQESKKFKDEADKKTEELKKQIDELKKASAGEGSSKDEDEEVPTDFTKITLNETDIFYPTSWGNAKKETSKEDLSMNDNPFPTFHGEVATFGDYVETLEVINADSYAKHEQAKENVDLIRKIYNEKKINSSEISAAGNEGYLPVINAQVTAYNPKYIQNNDGSWRGFWYLANIGQAYTAKISFVAVMYNKDENKVTTINATVKSAKSDELNNKISKSDNPEVVNAEVINYMKTVYENDTEVKKTVDNTMIKICKFVK